MDDVFFFDVEVFVVVFDEIVEVLKVGFVRVDILGCVDCIEWEIGELFLEGVFEWFLVDVG